MTDAQKVSMRKLVFRCPVSGLVSAVQDWSAESPLAIDYYEAVRCTACERIHFINPRNGKVMAQNGE